MFVRIKLYYRKKSVFEDSKKCENQKYLTLQIQSFGTVLKPVRTCSFVHPETSIQDNSLTWIFSCPLKTPILPTSVLHTLMATLNITQLFSNTSMATKQRL